MGEDQQAAASARSRRSLLWLVLALIPAIPVVVGIVIGLGQPGAGASPPSTGSAFTPVPAHPSAPAKPSESSALPVPPGPGAIVAVVQHPTTLRAKPHGRLIAHLTSKTAFGSPETAL